MSLESSEEPVDATLEALAPSVERVLSATLGGDVRLGEMTSLTDAGRRSSVLRCRLAKAPDNAPATVVLKRPGVEGYDPESSESWPAVGLFNDWAGLQLLNSIPGERHGPRFFGGDRGLGFVLLEDLGTTNSIVQPLLEGTAEEAERALTALAVRLGRMHAATVGRAGEYETLRDALGPRKDTASGRASARHLREGVSERQALLAGLGVVPGEAFYAEIDEVAAVLEDPGSFLVYTHGDPCPDNCVYDGINLILFDFEVADFRHALLDGVYGRIHFPTCWCVNRIPDPVWRRMETTYRTELAHGCPEAADDRLYQQGIVAACAHWGIGVTGMIEWSMEKDQQWGISTTRQRILTRLGLLASLCEEFHALPAVQSVALQLRDALRDLWGEEAEAMPLYPAFREGQGDFDGQQVKQSQS